MKTYKITVFGKDYAAAQVGGTWMYESSGDWFVFDAPYAIHKD
jgi:hypothetical protein